MLNLRAIVVAYVLFQHLLLTNPTLLSVVDLDFHISLYKFILFFSGRLHIFSHVVFACAFAHFQIFFIRRAAEAHVAVSANALFIPALLFKRISTSGDLNSEFSIFSTTSPKLFIIFSTSSSL